MNEEAERVSACLRRARGIAENSELRGNGRGDAARCGRAKLREIAFGDAARDVNEVPRRGLGARGAHIVGPGGGVGKGVEVGVLAKAPQRGVYGRGGKNLGDHRFGGVAQVTLGDERDHFVALAAPREGRGRTAEEQQEKKEGSDARLHGSEDSTSAQRASQRWRAPGLARATRLAKRSRFCGFLPATARRRRFGPRVSGRC